MPLIESETITTLQVTLKEADIFKNQRKNEEYMQRIQRQYLGKLTTRVARRFLPHLRYFTMKATRQGSKRLAALLRLFRFCLVSVRPVLDTSISLVLVRLKYVRIWVSTNSTPRNTKEGGEEKKHRSQTSKQLRMGQHMHVPHMLGQQR